MRTAAQRKTGAGGSAAELLREDRIILVILIAHLPVIMFLVPAGYGTDTFAIYAAILVGVLTLTAYLTLQGTPWFGRLAAVALVTLSAILVQAQLGRSEMHFHAFLALALLLIYRNWVVIALAAAVVIVHHLTFTALQLHGVGLGEMPIMLFNYSCSWGVALLHTAFVAAEALILVYFARLTCEDRRTAEQLGAALSTLVREKNLKLRIRDAGDNPAAIAFNRLVGDFARLTEDIAQCARDVRTVAVQLETAAQGAEREGTARHAQTTQTAAAVQTMIQTIQAAAEASRCGADLAAEANERAQAGHDVFERALRSTTDLQRITTDAAAAIHWLESDAEGIGHLATAVGDIAERAERLARDASTSGEDGSVSDPAALALAAQASAQALQELARTLQNDLASAVTRADQGRHKTSETSSDILQVGLALNEVLEAVARISDTSARIATAIEQQRSVTDGLNTGILAIADQGRSLVEQAQIRRTLASRLQQVAESLETRVSVYRR